MSGKGFNYGRLMQRAMRGLMAEVLGEVAKRGLPGGHHFFITFSSEHPGVDMPDWLRAQYPTELSIVLQHEFDDLAVAADRFSVRLSFSNKPCVLVIPFDAVTTFADPSENFGLRFDASEEKSDGGSDDGPGGDGPGRGAPKPRETEGEVVRLDSFRKK
jgi:hypothetical protein